MRNVIYAINITVDGCCDHTKQIADEELMEHYTQLLEEVDLQIFGRKTYQLMVPYWPDIAKNQSETKAENEFAKAFVSKQKVVFSRSLDRVEDKNTRVVRSNLRDEVLKLKQEPGQSILLGGVDIPSQLIELDLVDEYRFVVQPVLAGEGRKLLEAVKLTEKRRLTLVESKPLQSGSVALRYLKQRKKNGAVRGPAPFSRSSIFRIQTLNRLRDRDRCESLLRRLFTDATNDGAESVASTR